MKRRNMVKSMSVFPFLGISLKVNAMEKLAHIGERTAEMPLLFLGHGSPMNAIEDNEFTRGFREIGSRISRPSAILCISAHWETRGTYLTAMKQPKTIHDFGGFPGELYEVQYPAPGSPELAEEARDLLKDHNAGLDNAWGLDHGAWSVIRHLYPKAEVPVVQMSIDYTKDARYHYNLAKELHKLRSRGVLIIGSGNMIHNLGMIAWSRMNEPDYSYDWAKEVREKMNKWILEDNHVDLVDYAKHGSSFKQAIPTPEHYLPLLYILGLKGKNENLELFNDKAVAGSLSMTSVLIHPENN